MDIVEKYLSGVSIAELARQENVCRKTIRNKLKEAGVWNNAKKETGFANITKEELEYLIENNTVEGIGEMYGVVNATVWERLKRYNIKTRCRRKAHNKIPAPPREALVDLYENQKLSFNEIRLEFDVSVNVVIRWMKEYGIPFRDKTENQTLVMRKYNDDFFAKHGYYPQGRKSVLEKMIRTKTERGTLHPPHHKKGCKYEQDTLMDFLNSNGGNFVRGDYSILETQELDFIDFGRRLAFEYCGTHWHHDGHERMDSKYHQNKYLRCLDKGITLITIFSDEWLYEKGIREKLLNILNGTYEETVTQGKEEIITDNRFVSRFRMERLGYKLVEEIPPDYTIVFENRTKTRKSKHNASGKYFRIWDCGKTRWKKS